MEVYWIGDDFIWDWPWRGDNFVFDFVSWRADIVCVNSLNSVMVSVMGKSYLATLSYINKEWGEKA